MKNASEAWSFLATPTVTTLRSLCRSGDFSAGGYLFNRQKILGILDLLDDIEIDVTAGRGLRIERYSRTVYHRGRDVTHIYTPTYIGDMYVGRSGFTEEIQSTPYIIPGFAIALRGPKIFYTFGGLGKRDTDVVDLERISIQ